MVANQNAMNALEVELYGHIVSYLKGAEILKDLHQWYDSTSWDHAVWESDLASSVELVFAEYSSGHRTAQEVRELLSEAISHATLQVTTLSSPVIFVTGTSSNSVKPLPVLVASSTILGSVAGKLREVEYA